MGYALFALVRVLNCAISGESDLEIAREVVRRARRAEPVEASLKPLERASQRRSA